MRTPTITTLERGGYRLLNGLRGLGDRSGTAPAGPAEPTDAASAARAVDAILFQAMLPFWLRRLPGGPLGSYRLDHDIAGRWRGPHNVRTIAHARTLWFLSRLIAGGLADRQVRDLAAAGFAFLAERLWDPAEGGVFWEIDPAGRPCRPDKNLCAQAFALFGIAEYAAATGEAAAASLARTLFDLVESRFHDDRLIGWREHLGRDFAEPAPGTRSYLNRAPAEAKLRNSHMHLMEALEVHARLDRRPLVGQRIVELLGILEGPTVRQGHGTCSEEHGPDWTPAHGPGEDRAWYGHDLESVYLCLIARQSLGTAAQAPMATYQALFDNALRFGEDGGQGGFFEWGPVGGPGGGPKVWWVQAEILLACLMMARVTGQRRYREAFLRTLAFIVRRQVDWRHGDWFAEIAPDGRPEGAKSGPWKTPYHAGRSMLECRRLLAEMGPW